jgi:hypothetical protein
MHLRVVTFNGHASPAALVRSASGGDSTSFECNVIRRFFGARVPHALLWCVVLCLFRQRTGEHRAYTTQSLLPHRLGCAVAPCPLKRFFVPGAFAGRTRFLDKSFVSFAQFSWVEPIC